MITSIYVQNINFRRCIIIVFASILFGYLFFEPFLTEKEEIITVTNTQKWGKERWKVFYFY